MLWCSLDVDGGIEVQKFVSVVRISNDIHLLA